MENTTNYASSWSDLPTVSSVHQMQCQGSTSHQNHSQIQGQDTCERYEQTKEPTEKSNQGQGSNQWSAQGAIQCTCQSRACCRQTQDQEGQQNVGTSLSSSQNSSNVTTLQDLGLVGEGQVLGEPIYLGTNMRVFKISQTIPSSANRPSFVATTIGLQRKTAKGFFTFYLPHSLNSNFIDALQKIH